MPPLKLFVDDHRECPEGWTLARTVTEAIRILSTRAVSEVSLDYDIRQCASKRCANRNETFEPVVLFIWARFQDKLFEKPTIRFHTGNIQAAYRMAEILQISYDPLQLFNEENYK